MSRLISIAMLLAISSVVYESAQWFRPTDYVVAFERWYWSTSGLLAAFIFWRPTT